jgi:hypothetical protein
VALVLRAYTIPKSSTARASLASSNTIQRPTTALHGPYWGAPSCGPNTLPPNALLTHEHLNIDLVKCRVIEAMPHGPRASVGDVEVDSEVAAAWRIIRRERVHR